MSSDEYYSKYILHVSRYSASSLHKMFIRRHVFKWINANNYDVRTMYTNCTNSCLPHSFSFNIHSNIPYHRHGLIKSSSPSHLKNQGKALFPLIPIYCYTPTP